MIPMSEDKKPYILLYEVKEFVNDPKPMRKLTWFYGTEEEAITWAKFNRGHIVDVKHLIPCDRIEVNDADK